jgi:dTDP-4-amino-4,6-dideoxygalactose transaminase
MDPHAQYAHLRPRILAALEAVIESGRYILGPRVKEAEAALADALGAAHGVGVANGTDALVIALEALGIGRGDEVVCPSYTFYATAEAIGAVGATPVFADIDIDTFQLDPAAVEAAITPRTRALMPVHLFGHPAPMKELLALAQRNALPVIEDAAQAFGASLGGERCGSIGDVATFSFFPTKNLPCFGDGGLIVTGSAELAEACRVLRFHGSHDKQTFERIGHNSRLDELQAAVLCELLPHVHDWNDARIAAAARYEDLGLGEAVATPAVAPGARPVYHLYMVRSESRDTLREALAARGIAAAVYYSRPLHLQPVFEHLGQREGSLPVTERAAREGLALPMFPTITAEQQAEVVAAVREASAVAA